MKKSAISLYTVLAFVTVFAVGCTGGGTDGGVFVTTDAMETWENKIFVQQDNRKTITIGTVDIEKIAVDQQNPDTIYLATTADGLWKTTNAGDQWTQLPVNPDRMRDIEIHPEDSDIVYSIKNQNIIKTSDGGETWEIVYTDKQAGAIITRIAIDWFNPSKVYAITSLGAVLVTEDDGGSWRVVQEMKNPLIGLEISPSDSRHVYVLELDKNIHRTLDGGTSWTELLDDDFDDEHRNARSVRQMIIDPNNGSTLYVSSKYGIIKSTDTGDSWEYVSTLIEQGADENLSIQAITVEPGDSSTIMFGIGNLLYVSTDGGTSWTTREDFPSSRRINSIVYHPETVDTMYIGVLKEEEKRGGFITRPSN